MIIVVALNVSFGRGSVKIKRNWVFVGGFEYGAAVQIDRIGELKLKSFGFE